MLPVQEFVCSILVKYHEGINNKLADEVKDKVEDNIITRIRLCDILSSDFKIDKRWHIKIMDELEEKGVIKKINLHKLEVL